MSCFRCGSETNHAEMYITESIGVRYKVTLCKECYDKLEKQEERIQSRNRS
jgi:hypothetical protein